MNEAIISILFKLVQEAPLSKEEALQLETWKAERQSHVELIQSALEERSLEEKMQRLNSYDKEKGLQKLLKLVYETPVSGEKRLFTYRRAFYAAAVFLALAGIGTYWLMEWESGKNTGIVSGRPHTADSSVTLLEDAGPGGNRASLTLADGSVILLDSAADGKLAEQGGMQVVKLPNGQVRYEIQQQNGKIQDRIGETAYNIITTPKGGQYQVVLPDGSKAWLNAASSIRFPTVFVKNRKVTVTGEVFFDIAADRNKQFLVTAEGTEVQVLGTSFNVNVYRDEPVSKISLLSGAIRIGQTILKPGQAYVNGNPVITNLQRDLSWKSGWFSFSDADLPTVMRQLSRWYDVEVIYEGEVPAMKFNGDIDKSLTLTQVLKGLGKSSVNYRMDGNHKIIILPAN